MNRKPLVNNRIRAREVRLIDENGKQIGILELRKALQTAWERNLDLVQMTEKVEPPVCKIMEYGKYLYQQEKKEREAKKKTRGELKGIRLSFNISQHDLETRVNQAEKFLRQGNKVRIELRLRGREKALADFAKEKMNKFLEILGNLTPYKIERELKRESQRLIMIISRG